RVIMVDINPSDDVASELNIKAGKTVVIARKADTTSWEQQYAAYEAGKALFGHVDYFFANAGIAERPWLPNFDPAIAADRPIIKPDLTTLNIDLIGQLYTAALALQALERQSTNKHGFKGKLLMTASVYGFFPSAIMPMYASAKAGIVNFTRSAAIMYAEKGITINTSYTLATNIAGPPEVSSEFMKGFSEDDLCTVEFVVEQFMSLLGDSKDSGRVIAISGTQAWDQPRDNYNYDACKSAISIIDAQLAKAFASM
ncbi:NAD-P-binding protein, partial [Lentinula novae-zelandiae]